MNLHEIVSNYKKISKELGKTPTIKEIVKHSNISKRQINKYTHNELCRKAGLNPNTNTHGFEKITIEIRPPKILILDIETAPMLVRSYGLWNQNISTGFIVKDWYMISFAAKWANKSKFYYADTRYTHENDLEPSKLAHSLIEQADVIVGHNLDRFDMKKLNTRFLKHNLPPIGKRQTIDTLKIAKKYFAISSNKLDYIAKFLGIEGKRKSKKYSQQEMWNGCCEGILDCFKENEKYNKQDITVTEEVFDNLKKWDENLNFQAYYGKKVCICGNDKYRKDGLRYSKQGAFQRFKCLECGKNYTGKENLIDKDLRKTFYK
jgi:DNA polymerase elongation subunit (family B)